MIAGLFLNPGFLLVAAALVSVPIIIHLINRMRFKRIRWAAMEFLLKAQKRTRRRLIIEQLILLALRCLLIALVGLLVLRFTGCGESNLGGKPNLHLVVLDDTPSMQDTWKGQDGTRSAFDVAKDDFLIKKIAKGLSGSKTNDQLVILPLSKLNDPDFTPKAYQNLNDSQKLKDLVSEINEMKPSEQQVPMLQGLKAAREIITKNAKSRVTLHVLSDYRDADWGGKAGQGLAAELLEIVKNHNKDKDIKIRPIDVVYPPRLKNQAVPPPRDNIGIIDVRPSSRIVGDKMPVRFTVTVKNFSGKPFEAHLVARNENLGADMLQVDFNPANPIIFSPGEEKEVYFDYGDVRHGRFFPNGIKEKESEFAHLSVRLANRNMRALENDALLADNLRHVVVEVRDRVPILVIDGDGARGREEGKDSFILDVALSSVPGGYKVVFGDQLPGVGGDATKALDRPDLNKYPTIFIANVAYLTKTQIANLENYVKEGGGVAFYMGKNVNNVKKYNDELYKNGTGVFPAPLREMYPGINLPPLKKKESSEDVYDLITREDKFPGKPVPIFSAMFDDPKQRAPLTNLPIYRYFKVDKGAWKQDAGRVFELASLPNDELAEKYHERVGEILNSATLQAVKTNVEFDKFKAHLIKRLAEIQEKAGLGREFKAYQLAAQLELLMTDKGSVTPPVPDLTEFWLKGDDKVQALKEQLNALRRDVSFGDPFVVAHTFGKGKVVAVMSTVGKDWNDWAGGCAGSVLFMPFIWELQNYLSSPGSEGNLTVGTNLPQLEFNAKQFEGSRLRLKRTFMKPKDEGNPIPEPHGDPQIGEEKEGKIAFNLTRHFKAGLYVSELYDDNVDDKTPISKYAHVFNIDTKHEGRLARVNSDEVERELGNTPEIQFVGALAPDDALVAKSDDFSESPWLFLLFLLVLVAEQALAVHLSFHLKGDEGEMAPAGIKK